MIDHAEQGCAEPPEPAPVETADYEQDQGKPRGIYPPFLEFIFTPFILITILGCALGYMS
jgi:hypothetical protein